MKTLLITFLLTATVAVAEVPSLINYQGRLTGPGGAPASGTKNFALKIYDAAADGTLLYSEDVGAITLGEGGVYSFRFGATGTSNTLITETVGTGNGENLYQKVLSNTPVVAGSVSVSDGTYTWSQASGSSNEDDFNAAFSTNLNRITVNYFAGAPNDGREIQVTYRYGAAGIVGALSSGSGHWLQLTIDGQVQATRERVLAVPFALVAGKLAGSDSIKIKRYVESYRGNINGAEIDLRSRSLIEGISDGSSEFRSAYFMIPPMTKKLNSLHSVIRFDGNDRFKYQFNLSIWELLGEKIYDDKPEERTGNNNVYNFQLDLELDPQKQYFVLFDNMIQTERDGTRRDFNIIFPSPIELRYSE